MEKKNARYVEQDIVIAYRNLLFTCTNNKKWKSKVANGKRSDAKISIWIDTNSNTFVLVLNNSPYYHDF